MAPGGMGSRMLLNFCHGTGGCLAAWWRVLAGKVHVRCSITLKVVGSRGHGATA
jgi:hypothetical protein